MDPAPSPSGFRGGLARAEWALLASLLLPAALLAVIAPGRGAPQRAAPAAAAAAAEPPGAAALEPPAGAGPRRGGTEAAEATEAPGAEPARAQRAARQIPAPPAPPDGLARLALQLRDGLSGVPLPEAEVEVAHGDARTLERADARGLLTLDLAPGRLSAVAWSGALTGGPLELELAPEGARAELLLYPGVAVAGRVVDARSGAPLANARVAFWTHSESDVALTDADGRFLHPRFPARDPSQQVRIEAEGYAPAVRYLELLEDGAWAHRAAHAGERDVLGPAGTPFVEVALSPALLLSGRVLDPAGRPLPGARVAARGYARILPDVASRDDGEAETDALGRFARGGLRGDVTHALVVGAPGCAELLRELPALAGPEAELGDLRLAPEAQLAGAVVDPAGEPAADARVCLRRLDLPAPAPSTPADPGARPEAGRRTERTDAGGQFAFDGLPAGRYELVVRRDRGAIGRLELELGPAEQRDDALVTLDVATWTLCGEVVGPDGPLAGAALVVERFGAVAELVTDARGAFRIAGLDDAATYTLRARAGGCAPAEALVHAWERPRLRLAAAEGR